MLNDSGANDLHGAIGGLVRFVAPLAVLRLIVPALRKNGVCWNKDCLGESLSVDPGMFGVSPGGSARRRGHLRRLRHEAVRCWKAKDSGDESRAAEEKEVLGAKIRLDSHPLWLLKIGRAHV